MHSPWATSLSKLLLEDRDLQIPQGYLTKFPWASFSIKLPKEQPHSPSNLVRIFPNQLVKVPSLPSPLLPRDLGSQFPQQKLHNGWIIYVLIYFTTCHLYWTTFFSTIHLLCFIHSMQNFPSTFHCEMFDNMDENLHNGWKVEKFIQNSWQVVK